MRSPCHNRRNECSALSLLFSVICFCFYSYVSNALDFHALLCLSCFTPLSASTPLFPPNLLQVRNCFLTLRILLVIAYLSLPPHLVLQPRCLALTFKSCYTPLAFLVPTAFLFICPISIEPALSLLRYLTLFQLFRLREGAPARFLSLRLTIALYAPRFYVSHLCRK